MTAPAVAPRREVPPLGPPTGPAELEWRDRVLDNGLRVTAIRQSVIPLVEVRLRIPFTGTGSTHPARAAMLAQTLLTGTARRGQVALAEAVQELGGTLNASVDADRLMLGGVVLSSHVGAFLALLAEVLTGATYPEREVAVERERLVEHLQMARSQPAVLAREALRRRLFRNHPYARELPQPAVTAAVTPSQLRQLHQRRVVPTGAELVLVGAVDPQRLVDEAATLLGGWQPAGAMAEIPPLPPLRGGAIQVVHRPGAVQSSIRMGGVGVRRDDPQYPAVALANLVFGGYFSSRMVANLREDKGYTYSARSRVEHGSAGSTLTIEADVATEVTAPAVVELLRELGCCAVTEPAERELEDVRQYATGSLAMSVATQAGLASTVAALAGVGLGLPWLREYPGRLAGVTLEQTRAASRRLLAPSKLVMVILGDAERIAPELELLGPVEVLTTDPRPQQ